MKNILYLLIVSVLFASCGMKIKTKDYVFTCDYFVINNNDTINLCITDTLAMDDGYIPVAMVVNYETIVVRGLNKYGNTEGGIYIDHTDRNNKYHGVIRDYYGCKVYINEFRTSLVREYNVSKWTGAETK